MFQLIEFTEATLKTLTNRVEKHGDDDKPAVSLGMEITCSNAVLDLIDPKLRPTFYKRKDEQPDLPDVEQILPVLQCHSVESVKLPTKHEGWTLQVDDGIDDTKPLTFGSCKVDKFSFEPKQGGSIVLRLRVGTSDLDAARSGMLGMHVGQSIWITLMAPEKAADAIDGSVDAFNADHPEAGDIFAQEHGDPEDDEAACPVDLITHCSGDYPMYFLAVRGTEAKASRGSPQKVEAPAIDEAKVSAMRQWCGAHGVEWQEPAWLVQMEKNYHRCKNPGLPDFSRSIEEARIEVAAWSPRMRAVCVLEGTKP